MIDEDVLRRALREEAETYAPPATTAEAILGAPPTSRLTDATLWVRRRPRWQNVAAASVVALVVLLAGARILVPSGGTGSERVQQVSGEASRPERGEALRDSSGDARSESVTVGGYGSVGGAARVPAPAPMADETAQAAPPAATAPATGTPTPRSNTSALKALQADTKVIKTGSMDLEVDEGGFNRAIDRITATAAGMGGVLADTSTQESNDTPTGTVTVRVPSERFEELLRRVRRLGDVTSATTHGRDVTAEFTDLNARLRALNATRNQLLTVLGEADDVREILAVQDRINTVQTEIEQLQGRKRVLEDETSLATLTVSLAEPGADLPEPLERSRLANAWDDARDGFMGGVERIIAASGPVLITALFLVALSFALRGAWQLVRRRLV